jgi:hypothetical protein
MSYATLAKEYGTQTVLMTSSLNPALMSHLEGFSEVKNSLDLGCQLRSQLTSSMTDDQKISWSSPENLKELELKNERRLYLKIVRPQNLKYRKMHGPNFRRAGPEVWFGPEPRRNHHFSATRDYSLTYRRDKWTKYILVLVDT